MSKLDQDTPPPSAGKTWLLAVLAIVLWMAYFALAHPPGGAPFIYAEF